MKTLGALIFMISIAMGIVPPKEGDFPEGVLENLRSQGIGESYGDPGWICLLYTSPSPRDATLSRMPSSA